MSAAHEVATALAMLREHRTEFGAWPGAVPGFSDLWDIANETVAITFSRMAPGLADIILSGGTGRGSPAAELQNALTALWVEAFQCGAAWSESNAKARP
jgi:hypothetical protein